MFKTLLSIQSHVSHGYVGSRAATFPLQMQGWDIDNINTVNFSNHTGYGKIQGKSITIEECKKLFNGLRDIQIVNEYNAIITGYIPNNELIKLIITQIKLIKLNNPQLIYLLDPVMGDLGYLYVDKSCILEYQDCLKQGIIDLITPNQFELELLCDFKINSRHSLIKSINYLHEDCNIPHVVITSLNGDIPLFQSENDENDENNENNESKDDIIYVISSSKSCKFFHVFKIPIIKSYFTGVGDLFSALLLDKFYDNLNNNQQGNDNDNDNDHENLLNKSVNQSLTIMSKILKLTHELGIKQYCNNKKIPFNMNVEIIGELNDGETMKFFELKIIQSKKFFDYNGDGIFQSIKINK